MRLLCVVASTNPKGGGVIEAIRQRGMSMKKMGHGIEIACLDSPDAPWIKQSPLCIHACGPATTGYMYSSRLVPWLTRHAAGYDAVIVDGIWQYSSFATHNVMRKLGRPYFVFVHGMLDPWFKRTYPLKHLKKSLYWPWAEYRVLRDAAAVCFTCEEERQLARQSFARYQCNEAVVNLGISVPTDRREELKNGFVARYPELIGKRILLFMGRIHPKKGCDLLIEAFAHVSKSHSNLHLLFAGPDQAGWQEKLQGQARRLGVCDQITWTGMLEGDAKWGAFHATEAFVLPSHQENFGIVVAEALAQSLPVLISNRVNIWREIAEDGAGLVAPDSVEGTMLLLERWLQKSPTEQAIMRQAALDCFRRRFDIHEATLSLLNVIISGTVTRSASGCERIGDGQQVL